jgi:hypothetical protein
MAKIKFSKFLFRYKLNVKEAIEYIVTAWDRVQPTTIANCWGATGILPNINDDDIGNTHSGIQRSFENDTRILQALVHDIPTELPIVLIEQFSEDFLRIQTEGDLNDDEIIEQVLTNNVDNNDDSSEGEQQTTSVISATQALKSLEAFILFIEQQPGGEYSPEQIKVLRSMLHSLKYKSMISRTQKLITDYFIQ